MGFVTCGLLRFCGLFVGLLLGFCMCRVRVFEVCCGDAFCGVG